MVSKVIFSVLTATRDRADLLPALYESLCRQTRFNFEWLVVDDGSQDGTRELVDAWAAEQKDFSIKYMYQEHGGKHRAINRGVREACGEYTVIMDSDDFFLPDAFEAIEAAAATLDGKEGFAGFMMGQGMRRDGVLRPNAGEDYEGDYIDVLNWKRNEKGLRGDRLEIPRTDILQRYPYPEFEGETFIPESQVWNRMSADGLKFRLFRRVVCEIEYRPGGLSDRFYELRLNNFNGYASSIKTVFSCMPVRMGFWVLWNWCIISRAAGLGVREAAKKINCSLPFIALLRVLTICKRKPGK